MPYAIEDDDIFRITCFTAANGQVGMNTFLMQASVEGAVTVYDTELANELSTLLGPIFTGLMCPESGYYGLTVRKVTGPNPKPITKWSVVAAGAGILGTRMLPKQSAGLLRLHTPFAGKKYSGRQYLPFPPANTDLMPDPTDEHPEAAYITAANTLGDFMINGQVIPGTVGNLTVGAGLYVADAGGPTFHRFDTYETSRYWATQMRRGSYGKTNSLPF